MYREALGLITSHVYAWRFGTLVHRFGYEEHGKQAQQEVSSLAHAPGCING